MHEKTALVTGAGSGIGREISRALAAEGYALTLVGRSQSSLEETAAALGTGHVQLMPVDIGAPEAGRRLIEACLARWNRLDVLVNNAGQAQQKSISDTTDALLQALFAVNFNGPAELIRAAWPAFVRQGRGVIVNISSLAAYDPFPGYFAYAASKAALESLARSVAAEGGSLGIRAYNVAAGIVDTPLLDRLFSEAQVPRTKRRAPREIAELVLRCIAGNVDVPNGGTIMVPNL